MNKYLKTMLIIFSILIFVLFLNYFYSSIIKVARISTIAACFPAAITQDINKNYIINGETNSFKNGTIIVNLYSPNKEVLKHEIIHVKQIKQKRLYGCQYNGFLRYINELEAYIGMKLPDNIHEKIYSTINISNQ